MRPPRGAPRRSTGEHGGPSCAPDEVHGPIQDTSGELIACVERTVSPIVNDLRILDGLRNRDGGGREKPAQGVQHQRRRPSCARSPSHTRVLAVAVALDAFSARAVRVPHIAGWWGGARTARLTEPVCNPSAVELHHVCGASPALACLRPCGVAARPADRPVPTARLPLRTCAPKSFPSVLPSPSRVVCAVEGVQHGVAGIGLGPPRHNAAQLLHITYHHHTRKRVGSNVTSGAAGRPCPSGHLHFRTPPVKKPATPPLALARLSASMKPSCALKPYASRAEERSSSI
jgi:hypothetical protein